MQTTQNKSSIRLALLFVKNVLLVLLFFAISANAGNTVPATVLYFDEIEAGVEPYTTRYIISDKLLRIDEGEATDSFTLFNAQSGVLYSITRSDQSIFKIPLTEKLAVPDLQKRFEGLVTSLKILSDSAGPKVAGMQAIDYALKVGQGTCGQFSSVDGLLSEELNILKAYENALVVNNMRNIGNQPADYITDCMLANELYAADRYLSKGFPITSVQSGGLQRF